MMLRVARIDISKRKNILASISKSNFSLYAMWKKKNNLRGNSIDKKIGVKIYGETDNLMNFKPGGGKIFVWMMKVLKSWFLLFDQI